MAGFVERIGAAIVSPRKAIAAAQDRGAVGRSGSDLIAIIVVLLLATELRWLYKAAWLGGAVDVTVGLRAAMHVLTRVLAIDLGFLVVASLVIFALSGAKRELGRAFDIACVCILPLVFVDLLASTILHFADQPVASPVMWIASATSYAWCAFLVALAIRQRDPRDGRFGKLAGRLVLAIALAGTVFEIVWIVRNSEMLRPMKGGEAAPPFSLPAITKGGKHGAPVALESHRGRVVVVDFWETWCKPCIAGMPKLDVLARKYPNDVTVLAINMDKPDKARELFDARLWSGLVLLADDFNTSERYGVSTIPHTVLIDRKGIVRHVFRGATGTKIEDAVEKLIAK